MAKYNFTLVPALREFIEWQIEYYPDNKRELATFKESMIPSQISQYGHKTGSFDSEKRPTEDITIRRNPEYILEQERIVNAIESVLVKLNDQDKELIRLRYWDGKLTPDGIALKLNIGRTTLYERLNNILVILAKRLGYIDI